MMDIPFTPPEKYSYSVEDFNRQFFRVWIHNHRTFTYKEGDVKSVWGFIRKKDGQIVSPINAKKPGKPINVDQITAYSAMQRPVEKVTTGATGTLEFLLQLLRNKSIMYETNVVLNEDEIGILLSALQLLSTGDEYRIAKAHGSALAIHDKLQRKLNEINSSDSAIDFTPNIVESSF